MEYYSAVQSNEILIHATATLKTLYLVKDPDTKDHRLYKFHLIKNIQKK